MKKNKAVFGDRAYKYFSSLKDISLQISDTDFLNPYKSAEVQQIIKEFYRRFYNDYNSRIFILGINPGRFGGGLTGVPFTDPEALETFCGISNSLSKKRELSSSFVYSLIERMGGPRYFFSKFYLTALFPFALIKNGKNCNYYDSPLLYEELKHHIKTGISIQCGFGASRIAAVSLGKKNAEFLIRINSELNIFERIISLDHPRFIMQYRRKSLNKYLDKFSTTLSYLSNHLI